MLKMDSRVRSEVGRTDSPCGEWSFRPLNAPLIMRKETFHHLRKNYLHVQLTALFSIIVYFLCQIGFCCSTSCRTKKQKRRDFSGRSPKVFCWWFLEHMGVFYATTIELLVSVTTPAPYVSCIGQAVCRDFDTGNAMGSGTA